MGVQGGLLMTIVAAQLANLVVAESCGPNTAWTAWTSCLPHLCRRERTRCISEEQELGTASCGSTEVTQWGSWHSCEPSCGSERRQARYRCNRRVVNTQNQNCADFCPYNSTVVGAGVCSGCPINWSGDCCHVELCSGVQDGRFCYPGTCSPAAVNCTCASGFSGYNCDTITTAPTLTDCNVQLRSDQFGTGQEARDFSCLPDQTTVYTNVAFLSVMLTFGSQFNSPSLDTYPLPDYVTGYKVGLTYAGINIHAKRGGQLIHNETRTCEGDLSVSNPATSAFNCEQDYRRGFMVATNDSTLLEVHAENGGFVTFNERDAQTYTGSGMKTKTRVVFDFDRPAHCFCGLNWLDVGSPYTDNSEMSVAWSGWLDAPAGIELYVLQVYRLTPDGSTLIYRNATPIHTYSGLAVQTSFSLGDAEAGVYCFLLTVEDGTRHNGGPGNIVKSRRFLMYDPDSSITIDEDKPIWVQSAAKNTSFLWLTNLNEKVHVKWPGHFENKVHHQNQLLNRIESHWNQQEILFEDMMGQPPHVRSQEAIPNVNGVVDYQVAARVDHEGGRTIEEAPSDWQDLDNFKRDLIEEALMEQTREDGDSVRVFVKAHDVMNKTLVDSVLVHVDSSPPIISDVIITMEGDEALDMEYPEDLFQIRLSLLAYDLHSGIHSVSWKLLLNGSDEEPVRSGDLTIRTPESTEICCPEDDCYCIPKGDCFHKSFSLVVMLPRNDRHGPGRDYSFNINAINQAMLQTDYSSN